MTSEHEELLEGLLAGQHRALARVISIIENRTPGYRDLVAALYPHTGSATVIGVTGSPGAGKSTLVDKLAESYRERGLTVGIIAIDPSSPFTGGAVLGDRIRMASSVGDMDVFVRSMSARGRLGGVSTATADAVTAMDAFGKDVIVVETVGAGQNEIDIVRTADTVAVLVPPGSGDAVQTLKAGILEIADVFVVNKADRPGADRTVQELTEMIQLGQDTSIAVDHHGSAVDVEVPGPGDVEASGSGDVDRTGSSDGDTGPSVWTPPIVETVATDGTGLEELLGALDDHRTHLERSGELEVRARRRSTEELYTLLREDLRTIVDEEIERRGGIEDLAGAVSRAETDPYTVADALLEPVERCLAEIEREPLEPRS